MYILAASLLIGVGHIYTQLGPLRFNLHLLLLGPFHQETDKQELLHLLCVYTFQIVILLCYGRSQSFHLSNQLDTVDSPTVVAFLCSQRWLWLLSETQSTLQMESCFGLHAQYYLLHFPRRGKDSTWGKMEADLRHGSIEVSSTALF